MDKRKKPLTYLRDRFKCSPALLYKRMNIGFPRMKWIEKKVLRALVHDYGYKKQHGKKEHFMIPSDELSKKKFVQCVDYLYSKYGKHLYNKYT